MTSTRLLLGSVLTLVAVAAGASEAPADNGQTYDLPRLEQLARGGSPVVMSAAASVRSAEARVTTASALPNPDIEWLAGQTRARAPGAVSGDASSLGITLPLDLPHVRWPRQAVARAGLDAARAGRNTAENELLASVRNRYYEILRREAELRLAREDQAITDGIRNRIEARVTSGETGRYELIKAEAEALNALKATQTAELRVRQARLALRLHVGPTLPADFTLAGTLEGVPELPPVATLHSEMATRNPDLVRARAEVERQRQQLRLERGLRWPALALKAARDQDSEMRNERIGVSATLPLLNWRRGPIAEASAELQRSNHDLAARQHLLTQAVDVAAQQYQIARNQVSALESGILRNAEATLNVAQLAYRYGERSYLDVLDAQRVYRAARQDLISARYELAAAWTEIERLRATAIGDETP